MVGYFLSGLWTLQPWQQPNKPGSGRVFEWSSFSVEGGEFGRFFGARVCLEPCVFFVFWGEGGFRQCGWRVLVYVWVIGKGLMFFKHQIPFGHFYCCKESTE